MQKRDPERPQAVLTPEEIAALTKAPEEETAAPTEEPFGWDTAPTDPNATRLEAGSGLDVIAGGAGDARLVGPGTTAETVVADAAAAEPPQPTAMAAGVDVISLRAGGEKWVPAEASTRGNGNGNGGGERAALAPLLARLHRIQARHALLRTPRRRRKPETLS